MGLKQCLDPRPQRGIAAARSIQISPMLGRLGVVERPFKDFAFGHGDCSQRARRNESSLPPHHHAPSGRKSRQKNLTVIAAAG